MAKGGDWQNKESEATSFYVEKEDELDVFIRNGEMQTFSAARVCGGSRTQIRGAHPGLRAGGKRNIGMDGARQREGCLSKGS
jgi:hypothetical protein